MNRVVITGFGVASPIGNDEETFFTNLKEGNHGFGPITRFDASETGITVAAEVKEFPLENILSKKIQREWKLIPYMLFILRWKH